MSYGVDYQSGWELARNIRNGDVSPVDVVDTYLDRIEERNEDVNAYVNVLARESLAAAREAEAAVERGDDVGRLHGVPIAAKDLFGFKAGVTNTFGSKLFEDYVPDETAVVIERLEREGAIIIGKTNTPEFGLGTRTENLLFGRTNNPFDTEKIAGGSSGGAAAAVADGLAPIAQGSDAGGSIRIPAAICGVYGLKPTFGRIPQCRVYEPNKFAQEPPYIHFGPITRTVRDAALMLDVVAGPHPEDPLALPAPQSDYLSATDRGIDDLDVAYSRDLGTYPIEPAVEEVIEDAVAAFDGAAASVTSVDVDFGLSREEILDVYYTWAKVLWGAMFEELKAKHGVDPLGADREKIRPELAAVLEGGDDIDAIEFVRTGAERSRVFDGIQRVFEEHDLLVTPTLGVTAFDHDLPDGGPTHVDGEPIEPLRGWVLTQPFNMTGHPVASIPAGLTDEDLPVGLQIVGPRFRDDLVLAASAAFEAERPWHDIYPDG